MACCMALVDYRGGILRSVPIGFFAPVRDQISCSGRILGLYGFCVTWDGLWCDEYAFVVDIVNLYYVLWDFQLAVGDKLLPSGGVHRVKVCRPADIRSLDRY